MRGKPKVSKISAFASSVTAYAVPPSPKGKARTMDRVLLTQAEIAAGYAVEDPNEYTDLVVSLF